ncbi:T9SS type A sorting domain-containing protein [Pontibacter sp. BT310]|uniref:T9SS type A sorting domain-containing protein n=1 Tax=Pontibacter populi TaxID=890055 RepID=A0ABS6XCA2_9BACT|nr:MULTISPECIES: LamG-like jellyroll fold domain-containing protein [Pontibacter]MBJ6118265.1 T9SS type A sorting domain-containing protein [Pontibacter sp. BT310]MBR0570692.1 T9SS type A sorting domain-containing protein [Microvirga sp. STS03]MBW3365118.1 T9SS type A sorting domain-containing protein [Pontibacter populi]
MSKYIQFIFLIVPFFISVNPAYAYTLNHFSHASRSVPELWQNPQDGIPGKAGVVTKAESQAYSKATTPATSENLKNKEKSKEQLAADAGSSAVAAQGFTTLTKLQPVSISTSTGEKPQAKVWKYAGKHWAVLPNASGTFLWRLDGNSWTNVLKLSTKTTSKADCKIVGQVAHILLFQGRSSQIVSVDYLSALGTYQLWSKRTSTVGLYFESGVETATIDIDGTGRMWLASDGASTIHARWSDSPYTNWSAPVTIATGVTSDDIGAVIALPGKIGILWSNQNAKRFGFKTHTDGASPATWSADEIPASQSALNIGNGMADDHLNMSVGADGVLYCGVKTGYDVTGYPEIALLVRRTSGSWDNLYQVAPLGTRPVVILNEALDKVRVVYTSSDTGGPILYRESPTSSIQFGSQMTLLDGGTYNNSTSTKENFTTDIVVLASSSTQAVGVLATDGSSLQTVPAAPVLAAPANQTTNMAVPVSLSWNSSANANSYEAQVSTSSSFSTTAFSQSGITSTAVTVNSLAYNTTYYWRIRAGNEAGVSAWSSVWSFSTGNEVTTPPVSALVGHWKMNEGSGNILTDASGVGNNATITGTPTWISGKDGLALLLSGSNQYATVADNSSLDISNTITLSAWVRPAKVATQYIIKKSSNGTVNGYELSLASSGYVFFRINQASAGDSYRINSTVLYPSDGVTWMHIAATYDGSVIKLYINGTEHASKVLTSKPAISSNSLPLAIGAQSDGVYGFRGAIDDARVYNSALGASEISALRTNSATIVASPSGETKRDAMEKEFIAYPNPISSTATIKFRAAYEGTYSLTLHDMKGGLIHILEDGHATKGEVKYFTLQKSALSKGVYIARLRTPKRVETIKLMVN